MSRRNRSSIDVAAARLRQIARETEDGALLGSEDAMVEKLGVSRATVRQVARLLEREGYLRVKRGSHGGYFAGRPDLGTVEAAASAYLDTLDMDVQDVTVISSVLWVEVMHKAAGLRTEAAKAVASRLRERLAKLRPGASFAQVLKFDQECQAEIFALTRARYIELIFQINVAFARTHFAPTSLADDTEAHRTFVERWRKAKLLELDAIAEGDPELGMLAARRSRDLWHERIWSMGPAAEPGARR